MANPPVHSSRWSHRKGTGFDAVVVDHAGNLFLELTGYRTVALPDPVNAEAVRALMPMHA